MPALLYEPTSLRGKVPAVLNPNGHHAGGKAMDYKQARCINLAKRGMLALNTEFIGMGELRADVEHLRIALLDLCGMAGIGVFYLLMKRGLDALLDHRHADPQPTLLIYNRHDDCCFQTKRTRVSIYRPARKVFELLGAGDRLELYDNVDPGTHNYERDNRSQLYRFLNKHFDLDTPEDDLPFVDELRSEAELTVGLPADNATLHSLALGRLQQIRRQRERRRGQPPAAARRRLRRLLRLPGYDRVMSAKKGAETRRGGMTCQSYVLTVGPWQIPATCLSPAAGARGGLEIVISDEGRPGTASLAGVESGRRILAVDLFGTGEAATTFQEPMLLACAGERPLGILTAQLLAVAMWASRSYRCPVVHLRAGGKSMPVVTQLAAALEPSRFVSLTTYAAFDSLDRLIDLPISYANHSELFCFGLLAEFDIPDLLRLSAPTELVDRARGPLR